MAARPKGFGLTRELDEKMRAKYDLDDELIVTQWIKDRTGIEMPGRGSDALRDFLLDGHVLCELINSFNLPEIRINKLNKTAHMNRDSAMCKMKENENVEMFLTACGKLGMNRADLFQTVSMRDNTNMAQVLTTLTALSMKGKSKNLPGAWIGPKIAAENRRDFDEDKLRAGRNVIGLQMGTNQVASQKGMTGYGQGRQIIHKTN